ncbi:hypothetical protein [Halobellus captivus]|uniref:hypothetical protein n=1 Tax=Halobellus captivus TaxID=2592614 RepID=UPI0011A758F8|nr:hypothetical protein [Halobellus captivus]
MRSAVTLLVVLVVVIGTVPVGIAAATGVNSQASLADASASSTDSTAAQVRDNETATEQASEATAEANEPSADENETTTTAEDDSDAAENDSSALSPGAQLAGVIAVQRTEVDSEVSSRAFGQRVAAAATNDSKAAVIATDVDDSRERIERLRERLDELEEAHEAGEISDGRYRATAARLTAEINAVERRLGQANESASSLPESVREANGINASNIEVLRTEARNLSGPEVAEVARGIAGQNSGQGMKTAAMGQRGGPPGQAGDAPGRNGDRPGRVSVDAETNENRSDLPGNPNAPASDVLENRNASPNGSDSSRSNQGESKDTPGNDRGTADRGQPSEMPGQAGDAPGRDRRSPTDLFRSWLTSFGI